MSFTTPREKKEEKGAKGGGSSGRFPAGKANPYIITPVSMKKEDEKGKKSIALDQEKGRLQVSG